MPRYFTVLLIAVALTHVSANALAGREFSARTADEVNQASLQARPGDSLILADGTWRDAELLFCSTGTADAPITLRAQTPGRVVLTGHSRLRLGGKHLVVSGLFFHDAWHESALVEFRRDSKQAAENCRLTDCAIIERNPPHPERGMKHVSLYGRRNRVDHCHLEGKQTEGATLVVWLANGPAEHRIDHLLFGPRPRLGKNGGETIRVGDSETSQIEAKTIVESNYFAECNGEVEIISNKSCGNTYCHNSFVRCEGALTLRHGDHCLVEGNFFLGQGKRHTGGVRIIGNDHRVVNNYFADLQGKDARAAISMMNGIPNTPPYGYFQVTGATVAFNTFINCRCNLAIGLGDKAAVLGPKDCVVANNLFLISNGQLLDLQTEPERFVWQGNLIQADSPISDFVGSPVTNLRLGQRDDGLWRPLPVSPALGAAQGDFPQVVTDIDGQSRPPMKDVGCDQVSPSEPTGEPVGPDEVGVSWDLDDRRR